MKQEVEPVHGATALEQCPAGARILSRTRLSESRREEIGISSQQPASRHARGATGGSPASACCLNLRRANPGLRFRYSLSTKPPTAEIAKKRCETNPIFRPGAIENADSTAKTNPNEPNKDPKRTQNEPKRTHAAATRCSRAVAKSRRRDRHAFRSRVAWPSPGRVAWPSAAPPCSLISGAMAKSAEGGRRHALRSSWPGESGLTLRLGFLFSTLAELPDLDQVAARVGAPSAGTAFGLVVKDPPAIRVVADPQPTGVILDEELRE